MRGLGGSRCHLSGILTRVGGGRSLWNVEIGLSDQCAIETAYLPTLEHIHSESTIETLDQRMMQDHLEKTR